MMIKKKILAIIHRKKNNNLEFLALQNNPKDPIHGGDFYYVVTGGIEGDEKLKNAVQREIKEETGIINIIKIIPTGKIYKYTHPGEGKNLCQEECFLVEVDEDVQHLSEEHVDYKWLKEKEFIKTIHWYYDKEDLKELLKIRK